MEHLRTVVGELGGLARVEQRHDARIGHETRVGGHAPRDVLPQRDLVRLERAREDRRGEIGAPAAEGDDLAVAAGADEARHDDEEPALEQRLERRARRHVGAHEIGGGVAGATVGVEELLRVGDGARDAGALQRGGENGGGEPLTAREHLVARARRQLARARDAVEQRLELLERRVDALGDRRRVEHEIRRDALMPRAQLTRRGERAVEIARRRRGCHLHQRVRHAHQRRRRDDAARARTVEREQTNHAGDRTGIGERGATELVDDDGTCLGGHS